MLKSLSGKDELDMKIQSFYFQEKFWKKSAKLIMKK